MPKLNEVFATMQRLKDFLTDEYRFGRWKNRWLNTSPRSQYACPHCGMAEPSEMFNEEEVEGSNTSVMGCANCGHSMALHWYWKNDTDGWSMKPIFVFQFTPNSENATDVRCWKKCLDAIDEQATAFVSHSLKHHMESLFSGVMDCSDWPHPYRAHLGRDKYLTVPFNFVDDVSRIITNNSIYIVKNNILPLNEFIVDYRSIEGALITQDHRLNVVVECSPFAKDKMERFFEEAARVNLQLMRSMNSLQYAMNNCSLSINDFNRKMDLVINAISNHSTGVAQSNTTAQLPQGVMLMTNLLGGRKLFSAITEGSLLSINERFAQDNDRCQVQSTGHYYTFRGGTWVRDNDQWLTHQYRGTPARVEPDPVTPPSPFNYNGIRVSTSPNVPMGNVYIVGNNEQMIVHPDDVGRINELVQGRSGNVAPEPVVPTPTPVEPPKTSDQPPGPGRANRKINL